MKINTFLIILLAGLTFANNTYSTEINPEALLKIKAIWNYFTAREKEIIKDTLISNDPVKVLLASDSTSFNLLINYLSDEEKEKSRSYSVSDQFKDTFIDFQLENEIRAAKIKAFESKNFSKEDICEKIFGTVLNSNGCAKYAHNKEDFNADIAKMFEALKEKKELMTQFEEEEK